MRHVVMLPPALTITAGTFRMGKPAPTTLLITPAGLP